MYIKELFIDSFGCIKNKTYTLTDGINLLYGPNESGKTTVLDFIVFSFYGFKQKAGRENSNNKDRYRFSENGVVGGRIKFVSQGLEYVLRRYFINKRSDVSLYCVTTGEEIKDSKILNSLGEYFIGVRFEAFSKTAYLSSLSAKINADSSDEIVTKLRNLFETGNTEVSYKELSGKLSEEISQLESAKRHNAVIPTLDLKIEKLKAAISENKTFAQKSLSEHNKIEKLKNEILSLSKEIEKLDNERSLIEIDNHSSRDVLKKIFTFILCFALMCSSAYFYFKNVYAGIASGIVSLLVLAFCVAVFYSGKVRTFNERKRKLFTIKTIDDKIDMLKVNKQEAELQLAITKERVSLYHAEYSDDLEVKLSKLIKQREKSLIRLQALKLSLDCVNKAYDEMKVLFSPVLCQSAGNILNILSGGKYKEILVNDAFDINIMTPRGYLSASYLSCGSLEQTYMALRFALVELILTEKNTPLFLDDVFAFLDSEHLSNALTYIKTVSQNKQVFITACRGEEYKYLKENSNVIYF